MRNHRHALVLPLFLAASLGLVACGGVAGDTPGDPPSLPEAPTAPAPPSKPTPAPNSSETPDTGNNEENTSTQLDEVTRAALAAIDLAETETSGVVYELSDEDDDTVWELDVSVDTDDIEVRVNWTGNKILASKLDGSVDDDTLAKLEGLNFSMQEAVLIASEHEQGRLSEADLDRENGVIVWEVTLEQGSTDADITIDATTGEVLRVDRD